MTRTVGPRSDPRAPQRFAALAAALVAAVCMCAALAAPASAEVNISGTWSCCGAGGAGAQTFVITDSGGTLTGEALSGTSPFAPISGSVSGSSVTIVTGPYTTLPSYTATFVGTVSGETMTGSWSDNAGKSGTWTATRESGSAAELEAIRAKKEKEEKEKAKHPTATQVSCYYEFFTSIDTCTAQVADASGSPTTPGGSVTFTSATPGGFPDGDICTLAASPAAPTVPYCAVRFQTPSSELPDITAVYGGDATHRGSEGRTAYVGQPPGEPADSGDICEPADCSGLDFSAQTTLGPGQTSGLVETGCGAAPTAQAGRTRTTAVIAGAAGTCPLVPEIVLDATIASADAQEVADWIREAEIADAAKLNGSQGALRSGGDTPGLDSALGRALPPTVSEDFIKLFPPGYVEKYFSAYRTLPLPPPSQGQSLRARVSASTSSAGRTAARVIEAVVAQRPTSADVRAFEAALREATSSTAGIPREHARYELALTVWFALRSEAQLGIVPGHALVLASARHTVAHGRRARIILTATPRGARVLRLLEIVGMSRPVTATLRVSSTLHRHTTTASGGMRIF